MDSHRNAPREVPATDGRRDFDFFIGDLGAVLAARHGLSQRFSRVLWPWFAV